MKSKFKNRKELKKLADEMGLTSHTIQAIVKDPVTGKESLQLINNQRRFVTGMLAMSSDRQEKRIQLIKERMTEALQDAEKAAVLNKELEKESV